MSSGQYLTVFCRGGKRMAWACRVFNSTEKARHKRLQTGFRNNFYRNKDLLIMNRFVFNGLLCGLSVIALGCGGADYEGDKRFPITGTVTVDGEPMEYGTISFIPAMQSEARVSGGPIVAGKFEMREGRGANAGEYRVEIRWQKPTGKMIKDIDTEEMIEQRAEGLPARYHENSELTVTVSEEKYEFDFDLNSGGGAG